VPELHAFEYALIRVVPRVERGECLNAGVLVICRGLRYLGARIELDRGRLRALAPFVATETVDAIAAKLTQIERICAGDPSAGPIAQLSLGERWHWLTAPSSTIIQTGPVHTGLSDDPAATLDHLFQLQVALPPPE
jgi:hypothetical protein